MGGSHFGGSYGVFPIGRPHRGSYGGWGLWGVSHLQGSYGVFPIGQPHRGSYGWEGSYGGFIWGSSLGEGHFGGGPIGFFL